jgi:hypothetical protein
LKNIDICLLGVEYFTLEEAGKERKRWDYYNEYVGLPPKWKNC